MNTLIVGDVHGAFDELASIQRTVDAELCLQVGDLEPVRDEGDLAEITGPDKYKVIRDFPDYWNGNQTIPIETWFIGGNHEPWSFLHKHNPERDQNPELVGNLNYLGRAGVREIHGLTVAYLTGVYGGSSYDTPSEKRLHDARRLDWQKNKTLAHFRKDEVNRVIEEAEGREIDLLITHEWPRAVDFDELIDSEWLKYGAEVLTDLVELIEPTIYVAGHIHRYVETSINGIPFVGLGKLNDGYGGNWIVVDGNGTIIQRDDGSETTV